MSVASEFRLRGVDWDYYNVITGILEYPFNQPEGFAAHIAWQGDGEWRVLNLWRTENERARFFAELGVDRLSKGINLLGAVKGPEGVTDVKPIQYPVPEFVLGARAGAFAGINDDRDGEAIHALGGDPVAIELDVSGISADQYRELFAQIGYGDAVPAELISHHAMVEDDGVRIFETWSGSGHALVALGSTLLPAVERLGERAGVELLPVHQEYALQRISLNPEVVRTFKFS